MSFTSTNSTSVRVVVSYTSKSGRNSVIKLKNILYCWLYGISILPSSKSTMLLLLGCKPTDFDCVFAHDIISFANNSGCCHILSLSNVQMYGIMLLGYMIPPRHLIKSGPEIDLLISMLYSVVIPIWNIFVISIKSLSPSNNLVQ